MDQGAQATPNEVTRLLIEWEHGNKAALDQLMPLVYDELRRLAAHYLQQERSGHTLQPTALVNEAYLRLVDQRNVDWRTGLATAPPEAPGRRRSGRARSHRTLSVRRGGRHVHSAGEPAAAAEGERPEAEVVQSQPDAVPARP